MFQGAQSDKSGYTKLVCNSLSNGGDMDTWTEYVLKTDTGRLPTEVFRGRRAVGCNDGNNEIEESHKAETDV